jgi:methionyl-tRNA formyltransferase
MKLPIRVIFMGTPDFAVPSLRALTADPQIEVVAVITQPDRQVGRKRVMTPPPVKVTAQELGLMVMQPEKVRTEASLAGIAGLTPDVLVTAAYGQLLPQRLLDIPRVGCLNVHASLLPRWRGAAPIHRALMAGDAETGVTIMGMVLALDAGPIIAVRSTPIRSSDDVATLHERLAKLGAEALLEVLPAYVVGGASSIPQTEVGVTYAERIRREDEFLDWTQTVQQVDWRVRGLTPWPGACTSLDDSLLKIWAGNIAEVILDECEPATVREFPGVGVCVRCADGWYQLREVQPGGKRKMAATEWFRGISTNEVRFSWTAVKS